MLVLVFDLTFFGVSQKQSRLIQAEAVETGRVCYALRIYFLFCQEGCYCTRHFSIFLTSNAWFVKNQSLPVYVLCERLAPSVVC